MCTYMTREPNNPGVAARIQKPALRRPRSSLLAMRNLSVFDSESGDRKDFFGQDAQILSGLLL